MMSSPSFCFTKHIPLEVVDIIDNFSQSTELSATCQLYWQTLGGRWTAKTAEKPLKVEHLVNKCPHPQKLASVNIYGNDAEGEPTNTILGLLGSVCGASLLYLTVSEGDGSPSAPAVSHLTDEQLERGLKSFPNLRELSVDIYTDLDNANNPHLIPSPAVGHCLEVINMDVGYGRLPSGFTEFCCNSLCCLRSLHVAAHIRESDIAGLFSVQPPVFAATLRSFSLKQYGYNMLLEPACFVLVNGLRQLTNLTTLRIQSHNIAKPLSKVLHATPLTALCKLTDAELMLMNSTEAQETMLHFATCCTGLTRLAVPNPEMPERQYAAICAAGFKQEVHRGGYPVFLRIVN
eukprot:TRINITY_DN67258_c4_g1_i5.p1 TRINITY_DN67258_c4_g1~~TRINITY_DN67258_c4_g1_i5.p1  ORF type:complete len:347 (-),score=37.00 TRINITY_DN67258_c4_g1_i5:29-1069(-)